MASKWAYWSIIHMNSLDFNDSLQAMFNFVLAE